MSTTAGVVNLRGRGLGAGGSGYYPPMVRWPLVATLAWATMLSAGLLTAGQDSAQPDWKLVVLGIAQDGGIPHLGCTAGPCAAARAGARRVEKVASIGVVNRRSGAAYLFDATPDFPAQVHALTGGRPPDGIFLTHAHIGHYTGLMHLGREVLGARRVPVYGTARMAAFLRGNGPWSLLVSNGNIDLQTFEPDRPLELPGGLRVTAFQVPHRDEFSDTVGYRIQGPRATALYVPDTDRWETWRKNIRDLAETADLALLDGTFASPAEVKGRDIAEIPHPMMSVTRNLLRGIRARVWFIHVNHTNPELGAADVVREGMDFEM
jgi:pyrroloquinoline quinone biosynthesis protein B